MMNISIIQPSRNNLQYLKWSYNSIRKNLGQNHEICWADDNSKDGSWEWMQKIAKTDPNIKIWKNVSGKRMGHTLLYDLLIEKISTKNIIMIYHADIYSAPNMIDNMIKYLKPGVVVSGTRIEPDIHPAGLEKIQQNFGLEPEEFVENDFLKFVEQQNTKWKDKTTSGFFAPWLMFKEDFLKINGHDPLYAPQSREDSDFGNRCVLVGYKLIQARDAFCYHMTMRGSRRNPLLTNNLQDSDEWTIQNAKSTRNFIRKWGHIIKVNKYLHPQIPPKYDIGFVVKNCSVGDIFTLEPWCSKLYTDIEQPAINEYLKQEQPNTLYDLQKRVINKHIQSPPDNNIIVEFDCSELNNQNIQVLTRLSEIIKDSGEIGEFELECFKISIRSLKHYENELIVADKSGKLR